MLKILSFVSYTFPHVYDEDVSNYLVDMGTYESKDRENFVATEEDFVSLLRQKITNVKNSGIQEYYCEMFKEVVLQLCQDAIWDLAVNKGRSDPVVHQEL